MSTQSQTSTALSNFIAGSRDTIPMLVGAAPFGVIYGSLAAGSQMSAWQGQMMSLSVFAGSSQFIALGLTAGHAGILLILLATLIVNLRHMLYAASLLPHVAHLPARWRWSLGFLLTDETFAVMNRFYRQAHDPALGHWYFLGSGISMYLNWQLWTLIGLVFGVAFPHLQSLGLDFAMVATFIAIVVPQLGRRPYLAAALGAGGLSYVLKDYPYKLGLLAAIIGGVLIGVMLQHHARRSYRSSEAA